MAIQHIIDYITMHLELGESKEQIKHALLTSGWQEAKVDEAFASLGKDTPLLPLDPPSLPFPEDTGFLLPPPDGKENTGASLLPSAESSGDRTKESAKSSPLSSKVLASPPQAFSPSSVNLEAQIPMLRRQGKEEIHRQKRGHARSGVVPLLLGMVFGVVLFGLAAFGFWYLVLSDRQSPEAILLMSIQKMAAVKSYSISAETNIKTDTALSSWLPFLQSETSIQPPDNGKTQLPVKQESILSISGDGASDSRDANHPKGFFSLHVQADSPADRIKAKFGIDARIDGETIYFRLNDVDLSNTSLALLSRFASRWIQGNLTTLTKQYSASAALEAQLPNAGDDVAKRIGEAPNKQGFSPQELAQLVSIFQQTKPLLVTVLPEAGEAGIPLYHVGIVPQEEGVKQFLLASLDVFKQNGLQEKDAIAIRKRLQNPSFPQAMAQFVKQSTIELWIGKTDFLVRKVFSRFNFGTGTSGEITLNMSAYNQDIPVTLPSASEPIEQIIQEFSESLVPAEQSVKP